MSDAKRRDIAAGALCLACGAAFAIGARHYEAGTASDMGPGYFPTLLSWLLIVLSVALIVVAWRRAPQKAAEEQPPFAWRKLALVLGACALFGVSMAGLPALGLPPLGFVPGVALCAFVAGCAARTFRLRTALLTALALTAVCVPIFVLALGLPFPLWPDFL